MIRARKLLLAALIPLILTGCAVSPVTTDTAGSTGAGGPVWDAGNIISDEVFYNSAKYSTPTQVQADLDKIGGSCTATTCLRLASYPTPTVSSPYCTPYSGSISGETWASMLFKMGKSCGINPQVAMIMVQKESQGLTRPAPPSALTGFGCPDTGPGGSANCNSASAGVFNQTWGMFEAFAKLHKDPSKVNYLEGQTHDVLWNVAETGCGSAPVQVKNRATATLYTYTPYQPNTAALSAYPGTGDRCSAYGNRNFFELFKKYFGSTGGGTGGDGGQGNTVLANGVNVIIPDNQFVAEAVRGKTIQAPTQALATGLAAGFSKLGLDYVWGGGGSGGPENDGCARGGGQLNSCKGLKGFDCSGLTAYVLAQAGVPSPPGDSGSQRSSGQSISFDQGLPGDLIGFPGHIAMNLGVIDGVRYILEASTVGVPVHIVKLTRTGYDQSMHRLWGGSLA
jgi:cell wall-associated NlpC family hydrolase